MEFGGTERITVGRKGEVQFINDCIKFVGSFGDRRSHSIQKGIYDNKLQGFCLSWCWSVLYIGIAMSHWKYDV